MTALVQAASGRRLSESIPKIGAEQANFLSLAPRPVHGFFEDDGPGNLSAIGPRHDNDHVNFRDIQILPTTDEILAVGRPPYMPKKNLQERNHFEPGPNRLLDSLFRYLRYDSIESICDITYHAAQHLARRGAADPGNIEPRQETPSRNQYFLYHNIQFEELLSDEKRGLVFRMSYHCPPFMRGRKLIPSGRLEDGMLAALIGLNDGGRNLSVTFFEVYMAQSTDSMRARNGRGVRAAVQLTFTRPAQYVDVRRALHVAQGLSSEQFVLVEFPKLLYAGFFHCLDTLQKIQSTEIAFTQYIAPPLGKSSNLWNSVNPPSSAVYLPAYSKTPSFRFDLGCLSGSGASASFSPAEIKYTPAKAVHFLQQSTTLDDGQAVALLDCLTRELAFTQGPPGTGKTYLGVALTRVLLASRPQTGRKPILVVCLTNHALDSFLGGLLDVGITKIARLGRGSKDERTKKLEFRFLKNKAKMTQEERYAKEKAAQTAQTLYADIEAGCRGLNAETDTGLLSWPSVEAHLGYTDGEVYHQLTTSSDNSYARSFTFDYWAGGGDLRNLQDLGAELEGRLLGSAAREGSSISTEGIDRALDRIWLYAQHESARAEDNSVWRLSLGARQALLRRWASEIDREDVVERFARLHMEYQSAGQTIRNSWQKRHVKCLLEQDIIGLTTTACASNWDMLKPLGLEIVICEEAGEVMEAHTLCSLFPSIQHAVFIGDPQQLRPEVNEHNMSLETTVGAQYRLDESLFERWMMPKDPSYSPMPTSYLNLQRRMHPEIAEMPRLIYPFLKDHPATFAHPPTNGIGQRMFWVDHRMPEGESSVPSKSRANLYEVAMITGMVQYLIRGNAYSLGDIAVLTPYNAQLAALHSSLESKCSVWLGEKDRNGLLDDGLLEEANDDRPRVKDEVNLSDFLRIATIDNFQGDEAKVVILSTVRSGRGPGFLKTANRINVACSRAREGFYIFGNSETLSQVPMWRQVIGIFVSRGRIGPALRTCCSRHPTHYNDVYTPEDFCQMRDCDIVCGEVKPCGHQCLEPCHPLALHDKIPCLNPCQIVHPCGHQCLRLCSDPCGPCRYSVEQEDLSCGHSVDVLCSGDLPICRKAIISAPLPCGHEHSLQCCNRNKPYSCGEPCGLTLPCGHLCQGVCAECRASTTGNHLPCSSKCGKQLVDCGHYCESECHPRSACPPCEQPCRESCPHGTCRSMCSDPCEPCVRAYKPYCRHQAESALLCSLPSEVLPCCERCDKVLPCGHACSGFCSEVCPEECSPCVTGGVPEQPVLVCPGCQRQLDMLELDEQLVHDIYTIDQTGKITGFVPRGCGPPALDLSSLRDSQTCSCSCGSSYFAIRRYHIIRQLQDCSTIFDRLLAKIGRSMLAFSKAIRYQEKELEESFVTFRNMMRPNPLAANHNKRLVALRAHRLLQHFEGIPVLTTSTVSAFERSVSWLQVVFPGALSGSDPNLNPVPSINLVLSLRLEVLYRRARNLWIYDSLRVSKFMAGLQDPSLEVQRMGEVLRVRASKECWKGIGECENMLRKTVNTPAIEVEVRLQQIQLHHLLDIALKEGGSCRPNMPSMAPEAPGESLKMAMTLCRRFPDTAGRFGALCNSFQRFGSNGGNHVAGIGETREGRMAATCTLATLPRTNNRESRRAEVLWGGYVVGHGRACERAGHPYCAADVAVADGELEWQWAGCLECGREREVKDVVGMDEERKLAASSLFEDRFLEMMRKK